MTFKMTKKLIGQIAVVTGGNSGIGEAICHLFASEGATVVLLARREKEGSKVAKLIKNRGGESLFIQCDISEMRQVEKSIEKIISKFGHIDILVNNAGATSQGNFPNETESDWNKVLSVNLNGTFYMSKFVWPHMISNHGGKIINVSSLAAQRGFSKNMYDLVGNGPPSSYYASKAGIDAFTRYIASMGGEHNIRVNGVRPGQILTPLADDGQGRHSMKPMFDMMQILDGPGYPDDVAKAVLFLATDDSRFITGEIINIDGGLPAKL